MGEAGWRIMAVIFSLLAVLHYLAGHNLVSSYGCLIISVIGNATASILSRLKP